MQHFFQFIVMAVANLTIPEFIAPTLCVTDAGMRVSRFFVYAGSTLQIALRAKPSADTLAAVYVLGRIDLDHFNVSTVI